MKYYSIIKKVDSTMLPSPHSVFYSFYHSYIFRADPDGPTLMYDALYLDGKQAQDDLYNQQDILALGSNLEHLGVCTTKEYNEVMSKLFSK